MADAKEKRKLRRINSGGELVDLLRRYGTGEETLSFLEGLFPHDRHGTVTDDVESDHLLEVMEERLEREAAGVWCALPEGPGPAGWDTTDADLRHLGNLGSLSPLTLEKARKIRETGEWPLPTFEVKKLPVRFAAEEYDEADEEEAAPPPSPALRRRHRAGAAAKKAAAAKPGKAARAAVAAEDGAAEEAVA